MSRFTAARQLAGGRPVGRWAAVLITLAACTFDDISLDGRQCPCLEGWVCSSAGLCVRPSGTDAGLTRPDSAGIDASDAGSDSGQDAGRLDAAGDTGSGGPSDASANDAGTLPDAGVLPSLCDSLLSNAMFCDGFERSDLFPWGIDRSTGADVEQNTSVRHRGQGALRTVVTAGGANADVFLTSVGGLSTGSLYARGYYYVPTGNTFDYLAFLSFNEGQPPFGTLNVAFVPGPRIAVQTVPTDTDNEFAMSGALVPRDQWFCVQLAMELSDTSGRVDISIDGVLVTSLNDVRTAPATGFSTFGTGALFTDPTQPEVEFFADEVAYGTSPLPCDP